jgi:hypothetical protein
MSMKVFELSLACVLYHRPVRLCGWELHEADDASAAVTTAANNTRQIGLSFSNME